MRYHHSHLLHHCVEGLGEGDLWLCGSVGCGFLHRPGYQFTLPEGPFVYGKEFQGYILDGKEYKVGDKVTMSNETMHFLGKYRILPYYFVYFVDGLGNVVSEQRIMEGEAAIEPTAAMRDRFMDTEHYVFLNWTCDYSKVMSDLVINSVYMEVR